MARIDIDRMIARASRQLVGQCQQRYPGKEQPLAAVREQLLCWVWLKWAGRLGKNRPERKPLRLERTVRSLMREGLRKEDIQYRDGVFRIRLAQGEYILYKVSDQTVYAWPTGIRGARFPVQVDEDAFARFLLAFDAARPEILRHVEAIAGAIHKSVIEYEKDRLIARIRNTARTARKTRPALKAVSL